MLKHISLSYIACSSRSVSVFGSRLEPVSCVSDWVRRVVGFDPRSGPTQPGPAQPCAPLAPTPPMRPLLLSLSHLDFPRNNLPLPLPPLSPCGALGIGDGDHRNLDPEVSSPHLPFSSLSLSLTFPSLRPPLSLPCARWRPPPPRPPPRRRSPAQASVRGGARPAPAPAFPRGGARPPPPWPAAAPAPAPTWCARPCPRRAAPCARPQPPARGVPAPGVTRVASFTP
jgi:hypothetical protein